MRRLALRPPILVLCALAALAATAPAPDPAAGAEARAGAVERPPNPCLDPERRRRLLCPDLRMSPPHGLKLDRKAVPGRVVLRAGNSIDSVGAGPAELFGVRAGRRTMRARQRIHRRGGGRIGIDTGARLLFKRIPGQGRYWKFHHAARFDLWRLDRRGRRTRRVRGGPKISYCLRDLDHTRPRLRRSPRKRVYPACNQSWRRKRVTLGTSVGWSDVYPPTYHQQWIDVTGLRGCFAYEHTADPRNGIYESDEDNNSAAVTVRLPFRPGPQRCPGTPSKPRRREQPSYVYY